MHSESTSIDAARFQKAGGREHQPRAGEDHDMAEPRTGICRTWSYRCRVSEPDGVSRASTAEVSIQVGERLFGPQARQESAFKLLTPRSEPRFPPAFVRVTRPSAVELFGGCAWPFRGGSLDSGHLP